VRLNFVSDFVKREGRRYIVEKELGPAFVESCCGSSEVFEAVGNDGEVCGVVRSRKLFTGGENQVSIGCDAGS
jgi:hypothetical protein